MDVYECRNESLAVLKTYEYQYNFSQQAPSVLTSTEKITKNQYFAPALSAHLMFQNCVIDLTKVIGPQVPMRPNLVSAFGQTVQSYSGVETFFQSAYARHPVFQSVASVSFEQVA